MLRKHEYKVTWNVNLLHLHGPLSILQIMPKYLPIHLLFHPHQQCQSHWAWSSTHILKTVQNNQNASFFIDCPNPTPQKRVITFH